MPPTAGAAVMIGDPLDAKSEQAGERRFWSRWTIGAGIVLLLALVAFVCVQSYDASLFRRVKLLTDELDRTEPDWREPQSRLAPLPAERDSFRVGERVKAMLPARWRREIDSLENDVSDSGPPPCRLSLKAREAYGIVAGRHAAAVSLARTVKDLSDGRLATLPRTDEESLPILHRHHDLCELLEIANVDAIEREDFAEAWTLCRAELNLAKPLREGVYEIGLVHMRCINGTLRCVERTLAHGEVSGRELEAMQQALGEEGEFDFCAPFMPWERADSVRVLDGFLAGKRDLAAAKKELRIDKDPDWGSRLVDVYPRWFLLEAKSETLERIAAMEELKPLRGFARYDAVPGVIGRYSTDLGPLVWSPSTCKGLFRAEQRLRARIGCAEMGLAAERHRQKLGRWPAAPSELVDAGFLKRVPEDTFDGAPLRMRSAADGLVIYAVGGGRRYDGTYYDDFSKTDEYGNPETEFRLWNPDQRHQPALPPKDEPPGSDT
jgi:hypothetical protein